MNKLVLSAVVLAAGLATAAPAFAQTAAPGASPDTMHSQRAHPLPGERIEARLAYAKTALKITPAQEPQWNTLASVLRRHATAMDGQMSQHRAGNRDQPASAIERLTRRQTLMSEAAARMSEVLEAAKPLYAVLSDEQKKEADALLNRAGPSRGENHSRGHHSRGH